MSTDYWLQRYPHLPVTFWQLISGRSAHDEWSQGRQALPFRGVTAAPISPWHQQVGLKLEHYRMMVPGLSERDLCQRLHYSLTKYRKMVAGQYPLLLSDLEHLSEITGLELAYWLPLPQHN